MIDPFRRDLGHCIYLSRLFFTYINQPCTLELPETPLLTVMPPSREVLLPPLLPVTPDDHGAWVIVVSTILLIITILATTVTLISRIRVLRKLSWSDSVVFLSCVRARCVQLCVCLTNSSVYLYCSNCVYQYSQLSWDRETPPCIE